MHSILAEYHYFAIAASQVDIVAHSMGGLMARGFVQQLDYKRKENYTKGSIHRLITIGTPHFGGPLSKFLCDRRDYWYFFDGISITTARTCKVEPKKLRTIYADNFGLPIDEGGIEALVPKVALILICIKLMLNHMLLQAVMGQMLIRAIDFKNHITKLL
jgi:hypothetical protein